VFTSHLAYSPFYRPSSRNAHDSGERVSRPLLDHIPSIRSTERSITWPVLPY